MAADNPSTYRPGSARRALPSYKGWPAPIRSMWLRPQSQIALKARLRDRPYAVSEYSTLGGTVG